MQGLVLRIAPGRWGGDRAFLLWAHCCPGSSEVRRSLWALFERERT